MESILFYAGIAVLFLITIYGTHRVGAGQTRPPHRNTKRTSASSGDKSLSAHEAKVNAYVERFTSPHARDTA